MFSGGSSSPPQGYERLFSPAPHAFRYATTGEPVRRGERAERYELRDADCGGSDCDNFRARAEIAEGRDNTVARLNRDIWYGWSFYNETVPTVTRETWLGTVFGQWKLLGEQPSIFRLAQIVPGSGNWAGCDPRICTSGGSDTWDVVVDLDEMSQAYGWGPAQNNGQICRLFSLAENRGRWVDLVINTNFGTDGFGYLRVWVNGEQRCNYQGQLVSPRGAQTSVPGPTVRRGVFNSFTQRWVESFGAAPKPTLIVYYDEFLVGLSRSDVDTRLREVSRVPPVD